jgi:integrase
VTDVERKGWRKPAPLTFGEYADRWFAEGQRRRRWKPRTVGVYDHALRHLRGFFGSSPLTAIRPRDVARYVDAALDDYSARRVNLYVTVLHDICKTAVREELLVSNPAAGVERPKVEPKRWRILEPVEVARVAKAFTDEQARTAFLTVVLTGVRRSELPGAALARR